MGKSVDAATWLRETHCSQEDWEQALASGHVLRFPSEAFSDTHDLAQAMQELRPRLQAGDQLLVYTDGKSLGKLPDPSSWQSLEVWWQQPPPKPWFAAVEAPAFWPQGLDCLVHLQIRDCQPERGQLLVEEESGSLAQVEVQDLGGGAFDLLLHANTAPQKPLWIRLQWQEDGGQCSTSLLLLPNSKSPTLLLSPQEFGVEEQAGLRHGQVICLASNKVLPWLQLPKSLQLFQFSPPPADAFWVLLDGSGSMEGEAWQQALGILQTLLQQEGTRPLRVFPFQSQLLPSIHLQSVEDLSLLSNLLPYGPTRLEEALLDLAPLWQGTQPMLILSDGAAEDSEVDWQGLLTQKFPNVPVFCLPTGPAPHVDFLKGLGTVLPVGELRQQLEELFSQLQPSSSRLCFPRASASFPLPTRWRSSVDFPAWQAAPGAELLLEGVDGRAFAVAKHVGAGLLLGVGDLPNPDLQKLLQPIANSFHQPMREGWVNGHFLLHQEGEPPQCFQNGQTLDVVLFEVGPPVIWEVLGVDPTEVLLVEKQGGASWSFTPNTAAEWGKSAKKWKKWLEIQRNLMKKEDLHPRLLWVGLFLLTTAFVVRKRVQR